MDNPVTHATLDTRHRTKTNKKHNTENLKEELHGHHQKTWGEHRCSKRVHSFCFL